MRNQVQLITYANRLAGDLSGLNDLLTGRLRDLFGGVHILPFFVPYDGEDAGFDPDDHTRVDARLGTWSDITAIGANGDVMVDLIVNHMSSKSQQFVDWAEHGERSPFAGMFLTLDTVFPCGATEADLALIYRPRPGLPFSPYVVAGDRQLVWTTFTPKQIDLDVGNDHARDYLVSVLDRMRDAGVTTVRLDAIGYAVKTPGTSCFMTEHTFAFIDEITDWCRDRGLEVLVEVHSYYEYQIEIARRMDLVYDFALPPLVLHGLNTGDATPLLNWLRIRPHNAVTVLDTHDGIGVIDVGADPETGRPGLLGADEIDVLVESIHDNSEGTSRRATGDAASNLDLYQVNCTFYDALGRNDDAYLLARALQFFTPGVPQVYYIGLLAGTNDVDLLANTGVGRDVNRSYYSSSDLDRAMRSPVVVALLRLISFRNTHPAFAGDWQVTGDGSRVAMSWHAGDAHTRLSADFSKGVATIEWSDPDGSERISDVWGLPPLD
jgi:sucrose phosphorylase